MRAVAARRCMPCVASRGLPSVDFVDFVDPVDVVDPDVFAHSRTCAPTGFRAESRKTRQDDTASIAQLVRA